MALEPEPTVERLADANVLELRDWLAEHIDDLATTLLAPLGWPLVEVGPDYERACAVKVLVRGTGLIRVTLTAETADVD